MPIRTFTVAALSLALGLLLTAAPFAAGQAAASAPKHAHAHGADGPHKHKRMGTVGAGVMQGLRNLSKDPTSKIQCNEYEGDGTTKTVCHVKQ